MGENLSVLLSSEIKDVNVDWLNGDDENFQMVTIKMIRRILSVNDPDIEGVIKLNVIQRILELMVMSEDENCQLECAWIITNMASGYKNGTLEVIKHKGIDCLKTLMIKTNSKSVKTQCFWALSNIACEDAKCRNLVLSQGIFQHLLQFINDVDNDPNSLKICIWALANFFLTKFTPLDNGLCVKALYKFIKYFRHSNKSVRKESLDGLCHITDDRKFIDILVKTEITKDIMKILKNEYDPKIKSKLILIIGNIAYGSDDQTQHIIDIGYIELFNKLLDTEDINLTKEIVWILSNIAAGNQKQVQALMDGNIFPKIIRVLNIDNFKVRREAVWTINNATHNGGYEVVVHLVKLEVLKYLTILLDDEIDEIVKITCDSIYGILLIGERYFKNDNLFAILVDKYGALMKLEHLQVHRSWDVIDKVISILEAFFRRNVKEVPKI